MENPQVSLKFEKTKGITGEEFFKFRITSRQILLRMRNVSDKVAEKIKEHILCSIIFFRKSCLS